MQAAWEDWAGVRATVVAGVRVVAGGVVGEAEVEAEDEDESVVWAAARAAKRPETM